MDSACVYELTQGLQMAEQLRLNLHSPETRDYLIQKILSSYENALFVLKSATSPAPALPPPSLPESWMSTGTPGSEELECDQPFSGQQGLNVISKKGKGLDDNGLVNDSRRKYGKNDILGAKFSRNYDGSLYPNVPKGLATKQVQRRDQKPKELEIVYQGKHTHNNVAQSAEKHDITPTHHQHYQQSTPTPREKQMLSNLKANLSVNTSDLDNAPSSFTFPSTSFGLMEDNHIHFPNYYDDVSPLFISPVTSESNIFSEWGSSQSLDFLVDVDSGFEFNSLF